MIIMKCTKCGAELPEGVYFCGECGAKAPENITQPVQETYTAPAAYEYGGANAVNCPRCGSAIPAGRAFCPSCGYRMNAPQPPVNQYQMPAAQPQKSNAPLFILLGVIGFLIVAAVVVILIFVMNNGKNQTNEAAAPTAVVQTAAPTQAPQPTQLPAQPAQPAQAAVPPAAPPQYNTAPSSGDYLFPSDSRYITEADLAGRSRDEVRLMINEIYARHGYIFSTQSYQNYFASKSWYIPITQSQSDVESWFNSVELANKNFLSNYEKQRGWR